MPLRYEAVTSDPLVLQDFVVAEREGETDVGFVAGFEWVSQQQLQRRQGPLKKVLRRATEKEREDFFLRKAEEKKALILCKQKALELNLPMKIATSRVSAKDGRVIFQFTSEQRVDFRQLVRELSLILRRRIELWQIGVRDEARAVDGLGVCGLQTCCSSWLTEFRPISIRMAKTQGINLPPSKLSGQCGRLLCCLSYEVDQYKELNRALLPKGATVRLGNEDGVIIDRNVLMGTYVISLPSGSISVVRAEDLGDVRVPEQMKRMGRMLSRESADFDEEEPEAAEVSLQSSMANRVLKPIVADESPTEASEEPEDAPPPATRDAGRSNRGKRGRGPRHPDAPVAKEAEGAAAPKPERKRPTRSERRAAKAEKAKTAEASAPSDAAVPPPAAPGEGKRRRQRGGRGQRDTAAKTGAEQRPEGAVPREAESGSAPQREDGSPQEERKGGRQGRRRRRGGRGGDGRGGDGSAAASNEASSAE